MQKLQVIKSDIDHLSTKMKDAQQTDPALVQHYSGELRNLFKANDCHPLRSFQMPLVQMPLFISFFFGIQRIAADGLGGYSPAEIGFTQGGFELFGNNFLDLSMADSTYVLPVVTSMSMLAVIELGADGNAPMAANMKWVFRGMSLAILPFTANMPTGLFCYWLTNNLCSLSQVSLFKVPPVRDALGILPASALPKPQDKDLPAALQFANPEELSSQKKSKKNKIKDKAFAAAAQDLKKNADPRIVKNP